MKEYRIFVINPGSTSTKLSLHVGDDMQFVTDVFHDSSILLKFPAINDQLEYRMNVLYDFLKEHEIDLTDIDAIVGRGGGCVALEGGVYTVNDKLIEDTRSARGGLYHASMLGVQMASELHKKYGGQLLMVDPPVVDELCEPARITGVKGIYRKAVSHALNLKAVARHHAKLSGKKYEECNYIVCHIDGGISVTAHEKGRMIDGNDAGGGQGPFTPTRMGSMAVTDVNHYLLRQGKERIRDLCSQAGGFSSHFGTSNSDIVHAMVEQGDHRAAVIWNAMIYQVCKNIGAMAAVLEGQVDGIILTGGLCRFEDVIEHIERRCGWIAPISVYPGEREHQAMAAGALRVLSGKEKAKTYTGKPVWFGFNEC